MPSVQNFFVLHRQNGQDGSITSVVGPLTWRDRDIGDCKLVHCEFLKEVIVVQLAQQVDIRNGR